MSSLLSLIKDMQAAATSYLVSSGDVPKDEFINKILYLLDGPEQRLAEEHFRALIQEVKGTLSDAPDKLANDGPCCYVLAPDGRAYIPDIMGCCCGNTNSAANAAGWAQSMNQYLSQQKLRDLLSVIPDALISNKGE